MAVVLITGGTGFIGNALVADLRQRGYGCIILSRTARTGTNGIRYACWDPGAMTIDQAAIQEADYIIHLAGAGVAEKKWTAERKREILESRVQSGQLLLQSLQRYPNKVKALVSASAIGWYGPDPSIPNQHPFTEEAPVHSGFLGETCRMWEQTVEPVTGMGIRLVKLRIGIVLGKEGGALKEFLNPLRFGIAAILGNGKQVISWIHRDDLVNMFIYALENDTVHGAYNAVAPRPVTNKELTMVLARIRRRLFIPVRVPSLLLKILLGEMSVEVLKSATVSAAKIIGTGFQFSYPEISQAIEKEMTQTR